VARHLAVSARCCNKHQFAESDILLVNGTFVGSLEKRRNIILAIQKTSKKCPGKVSVCVTMPYQNTFAPVSFFHKTFQLNEVIIEMFLQFIGDSHFPCCIF
jgi:hypothetical protein